MSVRGFMWAIGGGRDSIWSGLWKGLIQPN